MMRKMATHIITPNAMALQMPTMARLLSCCAIDCLTALTRRREGDAENTDAEQAERCRLTHRHEVGGR